MIYCVEDDNAIRELVLYTLRGTGFEAEGFENAAALEQGLARALPQLLLLDIMLPGEDGISILKRLRAREATRDLPVILLTARGEEYDKVIGLDCGADDYVTKPFGMMELVSRIKALLRRAKPEPEPQCLCCGSLLLDLRGHTLRNNDIPVELTFKEFELLRLLLQNRGAVLTRDLLLQTIWGYDFDGETRTVDVHVRTLRAKLGAAGEMIETVRGVGYKIGGAI